VRQSGGIEALPVGFSERPHSIQIGVQLFSCTATIMWQRIISLNFQIAFNRFFINVQAFEERMLISDALAGSFLCPRGLTRHNFELRRATVVHAPPHSRMSILIYET
jgi:hypothetical protein